MSRSRQRTLVVAGAVAGVTAGAIASATVPGERAPASATTAASPAAVVSDVRRTGRMRPLPPGPGVVRLRAVGPVRVAVRVADPRGGPDWAVRTFLAERLAPPAPGARRPGAVIARERCAQLGRLHAGRFGWLEPTGTFRPVGIRLTGAPWQCAPRDADLGARPYGEAYTTTTDPRRPVAALVQTVVWGLAGPATEAASLRVRGRATPIALGGPGALLAVLPPDARRGDLRLDVRAGGRTRPILSPELRPGGPPSARPTGPGAPDPRSPVVVAAQAPDPDGGLPYGVAAVRAVGGGWCTAAGARVVGDRIGGVDFDLGLLHEVRPGLNCSPAGRRRPRGGAPFVLERVGATGGLPGADPAQGRTARRTLPGRTLVAGTADADVASLTLATPRDVRTLVPSGPARAFLAVYAGDFPTGQLVITTRFRDGRTRRDVLPAGV